MEYIELSLRLFFKYCNSFFENIFGDYIMTVVLFYSCQQYLKKLHMQERAIEEVKLAIKPFYQRRDINKDEYKEILRKAVQKVG